MFSGLMSEMMKRASGTGASMGGAQSMPSPFGQQKPSMPPGGPGMPPQAQGMPPAPQAGGSPMPGGPGAPIGQAPPPPPDAPVTPDMAMAHPELMHTMLQNHQMGQDQGFSKKMRIKDPFGNEQEVTLDPVAAQPAPETNMPSTPMWIRQMLGQP